MSLTKMGENFKEFYDRIFPYLNGQAAVTANAFSRGDIIDTEERIVGMYMGKPMYQKALEYNYTGSNGSYCLPHGISNLEKLFFVLGTRVVSEGVGNPFPCIAYDAISSLYDYALHVEGYDATNINIRVGNRRAGTGLIIVRYTKTTDTAGAIKYGTGNDYSIEEQIVGTWIDGKNLYQKVITGTVQGSSSKVWRETDLLDGLDVDYFTVCDGSYFTTTDAPDTKILPFPYSAISDAAEWRLLNTGKLVICVSGWPATLNLTLIIRYTKTT